MNLWFYTSYCLTPPCPSSPYSELVYILGESDELGDLWVHPCLLSHVQLMATPWAVACQTPQSMGFSRGEYWSGLPFPAPGDLLNSGIEPSLWQNLQADSHVKENESEVAQSCPTLCDPMDCSQPGSSVHGIFEAIVLEGIAISFSRGSS